MKSSYNTYGYMLMHLGIVLALVTILVALSVSHGSFMQRYTLRMEVEKLYAMFQYLHQLAITTNHDQILTINSEQGTYQAAGHQEKLPRTIMFGILPNVYGPPSSPTTLIKTPVTFQNSRVVFHADGIIQPGTIYLIDAAKTALYALTSPISQISYVRTYRYHNRSWEVVR